MSTVGRQLRRAFLPIVGGAAIGGLALASSAAAATDRAAIPGTHPSWAADTSAPKVSSGQVNLRVYLASQDPSGLASFVRAVSDPGSSQYGHYLSPAEVNARFAPSRAEADAVKSWLSSAGFTVTGASTGIGASVTATGTVAQAASAFDTSFGSYKAPDGSSARAPRSAASAPSAIAADIASVSGLDTARHYARHDDTLPPPEQNYWVAPPNSSYYGEKTATDEPSVNGTPQPWNVAGYTAPQFRGAYGVTGSGLTGKGVTVAILDAYASPTMEQDADQFAAYEGDKQFTGGQYSEHLAGNWDLTDDADCGAEGWYGEETLDVESVHGLAPDANVAYYGAQDCGDDALLASLAQIVSDDKAKIVSDSWGEPYDGSNTQPAYDQIFQEGAAEGISFDFSSGDDGYEDPKTEDPGTSDQIQVDYPTSSPYVTAVGGTSLAIGAKNDYEWELPWGTILDPLASNSLSWGYNPPPNYSDYEKWYDGSGGGGVSTAYAQPWYQAGVVPAKLAADVPEGGKHTPMRVIPDVSADADPSTGTLVGQTTINPDGKSESFNLSRIGGTSLASPLFAGIEADAEQAAHRSFGLANPLLYSKAGTAAYNDVTEQTPIGPNSSVYEVRNNYTDPYTASGPLVTWLRAMGYDGIGNAALAATPGYDDATGLGSPGKGFLSSF